jgi:hypothetical protein
MLERHRVSVPANKCNSPMTPFKELFGRRSSGERKNRTNRSHATPSPEQETTSSNGKSPRLGPFSWGSRAARDLTGGASPSQSEAKTILEVGDLIKCRTASPVYTLQRLDGLESLLKTNDLHRGNLLETARLAVQVAYGDFDRARNAARQRMSGKEPPLMIHLADIHQRASDIRRDMGSDGGVGDWHVVLGCPPASGRTLPVCGRGLEGGSPERCSRRSGR